MNRTWFSRGVILSVCLVALAAADLGQDAQADEKVGKAPSRPETKSDSPEKLKLEVASWEQTEKLISQQKGKVVVVDLWSTSCEPCMRELPRLIELQLKHAKDVVCVTVNLNYDGRKSKPVDSHREEVEKFLSGIKANVKNIRHVLMSDADEDVYAHLKLASIPAVLVYDRDGKLRTMFDEEGFSYEKSINPLVKELVSKKK